MLNKKVKLKLELYNPGASVLIPGTYKNSKGDKVTLLNNGKVIADEVPVDKRSDVRRIVLSTTTPYELIVESETSEEANFFYEHINAFVPNARGENDNKNCKNPTFKVVDVRKEIRNEFNAEKLKLRVANMVNHADENSLYNIAFGAGLFTSAAKAEESYPEQVWLMVKKYAEKNPTAFTNLFERQDREEVIVINKAIALDIIKKSNGVFLYEQTPVGVKKEEVQAYFQHNESQYKHLRRAVSLYDKLPVKFNDANVGTIDISPENEPLKIEVEKPANKGKAK